MNNGFYGIIPERQGRDLSWSKSNRTGSCDFTQPEIDFSCTV